MKKPKKETIFKVQIPIGGDNVGALVYDRDHKYEGMIPITDELMLVMKDKPKQFVHGHVRGDGVLVIDRIAPGQDW